MMTWQLLDGSGIPVTAVFSFRMEHLKDKPPMLTWTMPRSHSMNLERVSLWHKDECIFQGKPYTYPLSIQNNITTWAAVAMNETFHTQRATLIETLNSTSCLNGDIKDCIGGHAGYLHIDRVTHQVSWVSYDTPLDILDVQNSHDPDSLHITPIDKVLTGISASVKLTEQRQERGMMDVGSYITAKLGQEVETYSGSALESQWTQLAFKALSAGYDIQHAELIPTSYQRADMLQTLSLTDEKEDIIGITYRAYKIKLLLSWALPITTQTTLIVTVGTAPESLTLTPKDLTLDHEHILKDVQTWMKAYAVIRSFITQVKVCIPVNDNLNITKLDGKSWVRVKDSRIQKNPIEGPIAAYVLTNEGGVAYADITLLWAPQLSFHVPEIPILKTTNGAKITGPKQPDEIVAWANIKHDAAEQHTYYTAHKGKPFKEFSKNFPMTQLEVGILPAINNSTEYLEHYYHLADA
jgi:hypothetical protein